MGARAFTETDYLVETTPRTLRPELRLVSSATIGIQDANANEITNNPILNTAFTYTGREKDSESGRFL